MTLPDLSEIAAALADDVDDAFERYVRATADGVYTGALRMLGDRGDAEDIMQETYARAYDALKGYRAQRIRELKVRGWTWTIAANLCRNRLRSRARRPHTSLGDRERPDPGPGTEEEALSAMGTAMRQALLTLSFPQRAAVVMRHVLEFSYREIAGALDRPEGTVKADVHRGLARLRQAHPELEDLT